MPEAVYVADTINILDVVVVVVVIVDIGVGTGARSLYAWHAGHAGHVVLRIWRYISNTYILTHSI